MYDEAIKKLRDIQADNEQLVSMLENGEVTIEGADEQRIKSLCDTYRWWGHCAGMAAWLLHSAEENV